MKKKFLILLVAAVAVAGIGWMSASNAVPASEGREWREPYETLGLSWDDVASICPTDGVTPCAGIVAGKDLTGWVWATGDQVVSLFDDFAPEVASNPHVFGPDFFTKAASFLNATHWTGYTATEYSYQEVVAGWTASRGTFPVEGRVSFQYPIFSGEFFVGETASTYNQTRGVWLWRSEGTPVETTVVTEPVDVTPPTIECIGPTTLNIHEPGEVTATYFDATEPGRISEVSTARIGSFLVTFSAVDVAGNVATRDCPYGVVVPPCQGLTPTIVGTAGNDRIRGTDRRDVIYGSVGADVIEGRDGDDVLCGGPGNDSIYGEKGEDTIDGGLGTDYADGGKGTDRCTNSEPALSCGVLF